MEGDSFLFGEWMKKIVNKILFTDFDETLLTTDKTIVKENYEAIDSMLAQGHYLAYTTGRPLQGALKLIEQQKLPKKRCFLLCFQGCFVYDLEHDKVVGSSPMDTDKMLQLVQLLRDRNIYLEAFGKDKFYCFDFTEATKRYNGLTNEAYEVISDMDVLANQPIYKVMAIDFDDKAPLEQLKREAEEGAYPFDSFFSSDWFYEFCGKGQNKGTGLKALAEYLQVPIEHTVAVGDEENDLSMILAAGIGVSMCNGKDVVKRQADAITDADNNHGGVAETIHRFILGDEQ